MATRLPSTLPVQSVKQLAGLRTEPHDYSLTEPVRNRSYEDLNWTFLFVCSVIVTIIIAQVGIANGDPQIFTHGVDSWGNICGRKYNYHIPGIDQSTKDHSNRSYVLRFAANDIRIPFYPGLFYAKNYTSICVSECNAEKKTCPEILQENGYALSDTQRMKRVCTMIDEVILPQRTVYQSCVPIKLRQIGTTYMLKALEEYGFRNGTSKISFDINNPEGPPMTTSTSLSHVIFPSVWSLSSDIVSLIAISFVVSASLAVLLQYFTRYVMVGVIFLAIDGNIALAGFFWKSYEVVGRLKQDHVIVSASSTSPVDVEFDLLNTVEKKRVSRLFENLLFSSIDEMTYWTAISVTATIAALILIIFLLFVRPRLNTSVNVFHEATVAGLNMPAILLHSMITILFMLIAVVSFLWIGAYILSIRTPVIDDDGIVVFAETSRVPVWLVMTIHVLGFLWIFEFILGCQDVVIAGAVREWYFTKGKRVCNFTAVPTYRPMIDLIFYSLGSVAYGALIVSSIDIIRVICLGIGYMTVNAETKLTRMTVSEGVLRHSFTQGNQPDLGTNKKKSNVKLMYGGTNPSSAETMKGNFKSFNRRLARWNANFLTLNRHAYVCIAMYGEDFHESGRVAVRLLGKQVHNVLWIRWVTGFCLFCCKISTVIYTLWVGVTWFRVRFGDDTPSVDFSFPIFFACVASYVISTCMMNVYAVSFSAIIMCYCDDHKRNNGMDRPYYSSEGLEECLSQLFASPRSQTSITTQFHDDYEEYRKFFDAPYEMPLEGKNYK